MAFRIHESVVRGEIDNCVKGMMRGKIWVEGRAEPVVLELKGNAWPDLSWPAVCSRSPTPKSAFRIKKYMELLDNYGDWPEAGEKISKEKGWLRELTADPPMHEGFGAAGEEDDERISGEEMNRVCEEALNEPPPEAERHREGFDWIRTANGNLRHPLQHRCFEGALKVWHACDELGLAESEDEDLPQFTFEFQTTGVKPDGALGGFARGEGFSDPVFTVANPKRAVDHLHKAQAGLEAVAPKKLLPAGMVSQARKELFEIREGILDLMDEFRGRR